MPPRGEDELDPVTLHNQGLMNMDEDPTGGFRKLNFLLQNPPFPAETFGNLLLLYVKHQYYDLAADVLAVNNTDYLVLERGNGRAARIYWTTTRGATPVTGKKELSGREKSMPKKRIFSTAPLTRLAAGNMSGLAWGNWLPATPSKGYRSRILYIVTNDMFAGPTRVHGLEVHLPTR